MVTDYTNIKTALNANGTIEWGGTAFPSTPTTNQHYWRTDLNMEFFYDGTRWLTTQVFQGVTKPRHDGASQLGELSVAITASTTGNLIRGDVGLPPGCSDVYLTGYSASFQVGAGTALSASHKWVGTLTGQGSGTGHATLTIDSGANSTWRRVSTSVGVVLGTDVALMSSWAKTGTPGSLVVSETFFYRGIAT